jgi:hypothetical protein
MITVTIGVLTTILLGLNKYFPDDWHDCVSATAFVLSAFVSLVLAFESIYEPRRMWIVYNGTLVSLYGLSDELEFENLGGEIQPTSLKVFFDRFEGILRDANANWQKQRLSSADRDAENDSKKDAPREAGQSATNPDGTRSNPGT